jgi:rhodanese-related sulfurtransferase
MKLYNLLLLATVALSNVCYAELIDIDNQRLQSLIEAGVPVIDVRREDEWNDTGVIEGSHLLTFFDRAGRYDAKAWFARFAETVDQNEPFVLICHSGGRTSMIGKWLAGQLETVYHVERGIAGWLKVGRPVVAKE